jgi:beta-N-acetylhexosaminidase
MHSFRGYIPPSIVLEAVQHGEIGAFCLFAFNMGSPTQIRALTQTLHSAAHAGGHPTPLIGVDQEGGQLIAITSGATELPGNMALGATRSPELAEQAGHVLGRELLAMGINMNFAPALDINSNPKNPAVGTRSFGDSPELVSELGCAMIRGMQAEGIVTVAKHFPGHGDTETDSHHTVPVISRSLAHLQITELVPFRDAIAVGVDAVLTAHIMFTALDNRAPATLSPTILKGLLRQEMNFDGLIITDAMDMYAVAKEGALQSIHKALTAGVDLVLLGHLPDQLELAQQTSYLVNPDSVSRIQRVRASLPNELPPLEVVGSNEHQAIAQKIADRAITVVRDTGRLPLRPVVDSQIAVVIVEPADLTPADTSSSVQIELADVVRQYHAETVELSLPMNAGDETLREVLRRVEGIDIVIVGTICAELDDGQVSLVRALCERGQQPIVVALRTPYDLMAFPMVETYLCTYSIRKVSTQAVARVLFGEIDAQGVLPCAIPGIVAAR